MNPDRHPGSLIDTRAVSCRKGAKQDMELISKLLEIAAEKGQVCVLATVIAPDRSTPRKADPR